MADKNPIEAALAASIHQAGKANAAPAGAGRLDRIAKADADLLKAGQDFDDCISGRAYKR